MKISTKNYLFILTLFSVLLPYNNIIYSRPSNIKQDSVQVYFILRNRNCASCCISAIKIIKREFNKYFRSKYTIVLDSNNRNASRLLKKILRPNAIIVNKEKNYFKRIKLISNSEILVFDKNNNLLYHFTNFTDTKDIFESFEQKSSPEIYNLSSNDSILISNILSPFIDSDFNLLFIQPEIDRITSYNLIRKKFTNSFSYSKEEQYFFYDSSKSDKKYWDMTFEKYPSFIHNYFILYHDTDIIKVFVSILYGYDKQGKTIKWKKRGAILTKNKNNGNFYIKRIDDKDNLWINGNIISFSRRLNDSISIIPLRSLSSSNQFLGLFNTNNDSLAFLNKLDSVFSSNLDDLDSITFCASDKNNSIYVLNPGSNKLAKIKLSCDQIASVKESYNFLNADYIDDIIGFFSDGKIIYLLYDIGENADILLLEEYNAQTFKLIKAYQLKNDTRYTKDIIPVDIIKKRLYLLAQNNDGDWIVEVFNLSIE